MAGKLILLGLTGPTGSGKSTVARILEEAGIPVIDADQLAREAVKPGSACLRELTEAFSPEILQPDGSLNRRRLAQLAFPTAEGTARLNAIVHPAVIRLTEQRLAQMRAQGVPCAVLDAPLLYESGMDRICDRVAVVLAPRDCRRRRILERDGLTPEQAHTRMAAQPDDSFYTERGAVVLQNTGTLAQLKQQVYTLLDRLPREGMP